MLPKTQPRRVATSDRRREILEAALECFSRLGYDQTTMADIRSAAQASTGSIYHHFQSKEQLAAALYLEGVRRTQEHGLPRLLSHRSAERGVKALVVAYLEWVDENRNLARFLLSMRHASFMSMARSDLDDMNRDVVRKAAEWVRHQVERGDLPDLDPSMYQAIVYGPCSTFARFFLAEQTRVPLDEAKRRLATAAWGALCALRDP